MLDLKISLLGTTGKTYSIHRGITTDVILYSCNGGKLGVFHIDGSKETDYPYSHYENDFESYLLRLEAKIRRFKVAKGKKLNSNDYFDKFYTE